MAADQSEVLEGTPDRSCWGFREESVSENNRSADSCSIMKHFLRQLGFESEDRERIFDEVSDLLVLGSKP